jgi:class 3 adenylate cyclase
MFDNPIPLMPPAASSSVLQVLLFSDIVGSTALKGKVGTSDYAKLLGRHNELFESLCAAIPRSQVLKHTGDGYIAIFPTASDAVRFALLFQQSMRQEHWEPVALKTRVGIHIGEVATMNMAGKVDIVGLAADLTARVMDLAVGGQILLTRPAYDNARQFVGSGASIGKSAPLIWKAHGRYNLKGAEEALELFEVGEEGFAPLTAPPNIAKGTRVEDGPAKRKLAWWPVVAAVLVISILAAGWHFRTQQALGSTGEDFLTVDQVKTQIAAELAQVPGAKFKLASVPVTRQQFASFVHDAPYTTEAEDKHLPYNWREPGFHQADSDPVVCVDFNDACKFYQWLGAGYRLPTEAEWQAAPADNSAKILQWVSDGSADIAAGGSAKVIGVGSAAAPLGASASMTDVGFRVGQEG